MRKRSARGKNRGCTTNSSVAESPAIRSPRNWWLLLAAVAVGGGVLGGILSGTLSFTGRIPPGSVAPRSEETFSLRNGLSVSAAADLLELPTDVPQTVEALKEEAMRACEGLVADLPHRPESHAVMALTYKRFGRTADAVRCWQTSLQLDPDFSPAYFGTGSVAAEKADYDGAMSLLGKAIRLNPRLPGAHNLLTEVLLDQGKAEEALSVALEHRDLFPGSHEGHFWLGQAYIQLKDYENAKRSHEEVVRIAPDFTLSYHSLAIVCVRLGETEKAKQYREKFAGLKEGDQQVDRGRNKHFRDLAYQQETAANTHVCAGNVHLTVGSPRKAEAHWIRAAVLGPKDTECREGLATLYEQQNWLSDALHAREELVTLEPENVDYRMSVATLLARLNQFHAAEVDFREAIEIAPERAAGYLGLVKLYLEADRNISEAANLASKAVELEPSARNYVLLSAVLDESGDRAGAIVAVQRAIALDPDEAVPRKLYELLKKKGK